jgi:hypothetical protein
MPAALNFAAMFVSTQRFTRSCSVSKSASPLSTPT